MAGHIHSHSNHHTHLVNQVVSVSGIKSLPDMYIKPLPPIAPPTTNPDTGLPSAFAIFRIKVNYGVLQYLGLGYPVPLADLVNYWDEETQRGETAQCIEDWVSYIETTDNYKKQILHNQASRY